MDRLRPFCAIAWSLIVVASSFAREQRYLYEVAPVVEDIEFEQSSDMVRIHVRALLKNGCFDQEDHLVKILDTHTEIIPRFQRDPSKPCSAKARHFRFLAAEVSKDLPASKVVRVFGSMGWLERQMPLDEQAK